MFEIASKLESLNLSFALVTIVKTKGIVPRKSGRMVVLPDGSSYGTVGGGDLERNAIKETQLAFKAKENRYISHKLPKGEVEMVIDLVKMNRKLYIIGYGHVGKAIGKLMYDCGYSIHILDRDEKECPYAATIKNANSWDKLLEGVELDEDCAVVITTHEKEEILKHLDLSKAFYVGFLSSRAGAIKYEPNYFVPMGLDIGAENPEEIAISVAAEILKTENKKSGASISRDIRKCILVRGCGDLATAVMIRLHNAGYNVLGVDLEKPTQIRRNVSFAEAIYEGEMSVMGVKAKKINNVEERFDLWKDSIIPILVDEKLENLNEIKPAVIIDAIIAKRNLGTKLDMAPLVIALGPGFEAGVDCHIVIETNRGHSLGQIIKKGRAQENTGIPGLIMGYGKERVLRSPCKGVFKGVKTFGDIVKKGDVIAYVDDTPILATIDGMVRGMLRSNLEVTEGFKVADIDPRGEGIKYNEPSDKARAIAGGVLEAVDSFFNRAM